MYSAQIKEKLPHITILHHQETDGTLWGTSHRKIVSRIAKGEWKTVSTFPFASPRDYFTFPRLAARAMRADKANIFVNKLGAILGIRAGQVYNILPDHPPTTLFSIQGDSVLHGGICEDIDGNIYFGEYFMNPSRTEVKVWQVSPDLSNWHPAHIFPSDRIRHIHGIYPDPYQSGSFWIPTGDFENECYLFHTDDNFRSFQQIGDGSQIYRAVRLFFTPDHICWLTDSNLSQNYACRISRSSGELEIGQKINASAWYGTTTREGLHVAFTTVEPGPAVQTNHSAVMVSQDGFKWEEIYSFRKDIWRPMKIFKYGVISCPSGELSLDNFFISGEGLSGLDGASVRLKIENNDL